MRNSGMRRGSDVAKVYVSRPNSAVERPVRWLAAFARVDAEAGGEVRVDVEVPARAFQHWTAESGWTVEPGQFVISCGPSSRSLPLETRTVIS